MSLEIVITNEYSGISPKTFLKKKVNVPYHMLFKLIKNKRITLNKKKIKDGMKLEEGDIIKIWDPSITLRDQSEIKVKDKEMRDLNLNVLFENKDFVVFDKKPGIVVQGAQDNDTSLSLHLEFYKDKIKDKTPFSFSHVHRLDKDTSGVLLVAKNRISLRKLNEIFKSREITKKYVCLCKGLPPKDSGTIKLNLARAPDKSPEKVIINDKEGKETISKYNVLKEIYFENENFSLVEVEIETGFMHQIRVHMKYLNCPIIGDKMYGNSFLNSKLESICSRQLLHAKSLKFEFENKKYFIESPMPEDLTKTLKFLET